MVFSSLPIFLDPPTTNWGQMQMQHQQQSSSLQCLFGDGGGSDHHHLMMMMPPPSSSGGLAPLPPVVDTAAPSGNGTGAASSCTSLQLQTTAGGGAQQPRAPETTAERARLARVPVPEPGTLRCPRCDSANTKFCYFNNYSLSQPRHFCKACRRYWTRGGALRNVPVGGGCRRNTKRPSKKASASSSSRGHQQGGAAAAAAAAASSSSSGTSNSTMAAEALASVPAQLHHLGLPPAAAALEASLEGYHQYHHYLPIQMQPHFLQQQGGQQHGYHYFADGDGVFADEFPRSVVASGLLAQLAAVKMTEHNNNNNGAGGAVAPHEHSYWPGNGGGNGWPAAEFLSAGFSSSSSGNVL